MNLKNNTILITGGSIGIGFEMARQFLELNNTVIICGRSAEPLEKAKSLLPNLHIIKCDVSKFEERQNLINILKKDFPTLNVLINNAGIQRDINFLNPEDDFHDLNEIDINLKAPIFLIKELLPTILTNQNSTIINVSSQLGFYPMAKMPIYCATKAAMHSLTKSLRKQLENKAKVIEIIPPAVDTHLNSEGRAKNSFKFDLQPDEYVKDLFTKLETDLEICFKDNLSNINASSKKDLDFIFEKMNSY